MKTFAVDYYNESGEYLKESRLTLNASSAIDAAKQYASDFENAIAEENIVILEDGTECIFTEHRF